MSRAVPRLKDPLQIEVVDELLDEGRNIDQGMGTLSGEAADQTLLSTKHDVALHSQAFPYVPSSQSTTSPSYYNHPMLKQPTWIWSIPAYLYVGGVAGVSATFGAAAQLVAPRAMASLVTHTRWIATTGGAISAVLLIHDLGRPERFLNMLRVFRPSSRMSMGSWILSVFSTCAGGVAVLPLSSRIFRPLAYPLGLVAGILGLGLSGCKGVLIAQTAVPVWQESYHTLPVLFLASATASAAFLHFFKWDRSESSAVERFGLMGEIIELLPAYLLERDANRVKRVGSPLKTGFSGFLWQGAKVLTVTGIVFAATPGKSRAKKLQLE